MNVVGYLVTLANLQAFGQNAAVKDVSVRMSEVYRLADELRSEPQFLLEGFKQTGFYRAGNIGKYLSKNLRDYINNGNVDPRDEGVVITMYFEDQPVETNNDESEDDGTMKFMQKKEIAQDSKDKYDDWIESRSKRSLRDDIMKVKEMLGTL